MQNINYKAFLFPVFLAAILISVIQCSNPDDSENLDPPKVRSYPSDAVRINKWIDDLNNTMIRSHAWDIWESITTKTNAGLPVWETWHSGHELFEIKMNDSHEEIRHFDFPRQFSHSSLLQNIPVDKPERPTSFNRYSKSLADYIWEKGYNKKMVLDSINNAFNKSNTQVIDRQIQTSIDSVDSKSFALKPVFQFISKDSATTIPYWAGVSPQSTTNLLNPEPHTWRQCVIVDPTGKLKPGTTYKMSCNGEPAREWPVVSLTDFYSMKLTKAEAENFSKFAARSGDDVGKGNMADTTAIYELIKEGNIALLTAMHVTGKEIKNWTWQTFWWSPDTQNPIFGEDRPASISAPWSNYNMRTAYYMVAPPGTKQGGVPLISFNPYLETNLSGKVPYETIPGDSIMWYGVFTNCMSCHRMAAYPKSYYMPDGFIDPADSIKFSKNTKTDFLWSIPTRAQ